MKCRATSRRTGQRCGRDVTPGSAVCYYHGSASPQARRKAVERRTLQQALERGDPRPAAAVLLDALHVADVQLQQAKMAAGEAGEPVPMAVLDQLSTAVGRAATLARTVHDLEIDPDVVDRRQARAMAALFDRAMVRGGLSPAQQQATREAFAFEVRALPRPGAPRRSLSELMADAQAAGQAVRRQRWSTVEDADVVDCSSGPAEGHAESSGRSNGSPASGAAEGSASRSRTEGRRGVQDDVVRPAAEDGDAGSAVPLEGELLPAGAGFRSRSVDDIGRVAERWALSDRPERCSTCNEPGHAAPDCPLAERIGWWRP